MAAKLGKKGYMLVSLTLILPLISMPFLILPRDTSAQTVPDVYVGIDMAYGSGSAAAISLIDQVSSYTNLFVVGAGPSTYAGPLGEILQHAFEKGMSFITFRPSFSLPAIYNRTYYNTLPWMSTNSSISVKSKAWYEYAKLNWSDRYLGVLHPMKDEPGGRTLDKDDNPPVKLSTNPYPPNGTIYVENYTQAADKFVETYGATLAADRRNVLYNGSDYPFFTCDYSLYWFDYKAGHDGVFAEFVANYSRPLNIALNRGAAHALNKEWGVIITYRNPEPPYLGTGESVYQDLIEAYDGGAKYIILFDSTPDYQQDILLPEHHQALQRFWQYIQSNPRKTPPVWQRTALVLPYGYGCGFRGENDWVWGLWRSKDDISFGYSLNLAVGNLLSQYGNKLDIIYDDVPFLRSLGYQKLVYWNDSSLQPTPTPNPSPTPSPTLSPSPTPTFEPTPSPTSTPTLSPDVSVNPTSSEPPTPIPTDDQKAPIPGEYLYAAVGSVGVLLAFGVLLAVRMNRTSEEDNEDETLE